MLRTPSRIFVSPGSITLGSLGPKISLPPTSISTPAIKIAPNPATQSIGIVNPASSLVIANLVPNFAVIMSSDVNSVSIDNSVKDVSAVNYTGQKD